MAKGKPVFTDNPFVIEDKMVLRTNMLNEAMLGQEQNIVFEYFSRHKLKKISVDFTRFYICLTGMKRSMYTNLGNMPYSQLSLNQKYAESILPYLDSVGCKAELFLNSYSKDKLLVFLLTPEKSGVDIGCIANEINTRLQRLYEEDLPSQGEPYHNYTVLSGRISSYADIGPLFEELQSKHAYSYFDMRPTVLHVDTLIELKDELVPKELLDVIGDISYCVMQGNPVNIEEKCRFLFSCVQATYSFDVLKEAVYELCKVMNRARRIYNLTEESAGELLNMKQYINIEALRVKSTENLLRHAKSVAEQNLKIGLITAKAIDYIKSHYCSDISQTDIAVHIGISVQYLSSLFNTEMKKSIPAFIRELRMEKAKKLLRTTTLTAIEIMRQIGIDNRVYFYSQFRKYEGCTTKEYRGKGQSALPGRETFKEIWPAP